jgi:hypothetical protein
VQQSLTPSNLIWGNFLVDAFDRVAAWRSGDPATDDMSLVVAGMK